MMTYNLSYFQVFVLTLTFLSVCWLFYWIIKKDLKKSDVNMGVQDTGKADTEVKNGE